MITDDVINPTPYQSAVLAVPESMNLLLSGGRGGGKSTALLLLILRHADQHGRAARPLVVRHSYKALQEFEDELDALLGIAYRGQVRHNRADHVFRLPSGAVIECGQLESPGDYQKFQGRSFTLLCVEEFGAMPSAKWVDMLRSNLRAPPGFPLRVVLTANPGGPLHTFVHSNYIARAPAWEPFKLDDETWVVAPSTYRDNPHLDHDDYARKLRAACASDEELLRAWLSGDWSIARGAFFGGLLREDVHMLPEAWNWPVTREWRGFVSMDWGSSAPACVHFLVRAPMHLGRIAQGSLIVLDELSTHHPSDLNLGLNWPPGKLAEAINEKCRAWGIRAEGVGDDYRGLEDTLLNLLGTHGIHLQRPQKHRVAGWARVRELLHNAAERNGRPGLYISARCRYFWATVPFLPRDPLRPEDVDTSAADHAADSIRYAVLYSQFGVGVGRTIGMY